MPVTVVAVDPALPTLLAPTPDLPFDPAAPHLLELERQLAVYRALAVLTPPDEQRDLDPATLERLRGAVRALAPRDVDTGQETAEGDGVPFVLVLPGLQRNDVVPAMRRTAGVGARTLSRPGVSVIDDAELATFRDLEDLPTPAGPYLLTGIDTGSQLCNVAPEPALVTVQGRGRTPLTIAEGLALTIVRPDVLRPNRCYSLAGSRTGTNQRVPAIWISEKRPKLGWCWDRNPHTWLGTASARGRVGSATLQG